jgi:PAS domain S-box-containing protein
MVEMFKSQRQLVDFVQVAFVLTDVHSKILYANRFAEGLFSYGRDEMEGQRIRILFLEEDLTYFLPNIIYLTLYKNGFEGEGLLKQREGKRVFVHIATASFKEGGEIFLTFSFQEIQRLKKLEKEKAEMERWANLGMMVEEIAHRIRNPIVSIGGYAKRLSKAKSSRSVPTTYLDRIFDETQKLEGMIQRVEECILISKPAFRREKVKEVVEAALQAFSKEAAEKGIAFSLDTGTLKENGSFFIDRGLVVRALSHILRNSVEALEKARAKRKKVRFALFENEESVGISISDQGEGISKKNLSRIFEPFFSTRPGHMGLGLTFGKKVMVEHGGEIRAESLPRKGTTLTLIFRKDRRRKIRRELLSSEVLR